MKKIICFLLASLLLVLPACAGGASHEGDSSSGDSSSEGSASKKGEYKIKYQEDIELTLKLNEDHSFTLSGAEDPDEIEPEDGKNRFGIEMSESVKVIEIITMYGTFEITGDNTIKADSDRQTTRVELQGKDAEKLRSAMLKECENAYERDAVNGKEVDTPYLSRDILTIKLNDSDFTGLVLSDEAYDEGGLLSSKVEFEYDENGALTLFKRESYEEGELSSSRETKYEYDSDGVVVKESSYDSEGRLTALREYWPNTSDATAKHRENILKASYQYDEDGNITWGFDYDEEGNVIKTYPGY